MDYLSYDDFVRAHNLAPLVDIKTACRVANVGHSRFYELVKGGAFVLIPNGSRRNISAKNLHQHYLGLIAAAQWSFQRFASWVQSVRLSALPSAGGCAHDGNGGGAWCGDGRVMGHQAA